MEKVREQLMAPLMDLVSGKDIWFAPSIPKKKLDGAIKAYATSVQPERVIALHDTTIFGGGGEGFLVTDAAFYCKKYKDHDAEIRFENIERVVIRDDEAIPGISEKVVMCRLAVLLKSGGEILFEGVRIDTFASVDGLRKFFDRVIALRDEGAVATEDRFVIVQDMSQEFRVAYVKMAIYLALADDNEVDAGELAEIQLLMTRLELSPTARREVWRFLSSPAGPPANVLKELEELAPKGAWSVLSLSLLKDLIGVSRRRRAGEVGADDPFVAQGGRIKSC